MTAPNITLDELEIVDIHPHIVSPDRERFPFKPLLGRASGWSQTRPVSIEQLLVEMDGAGVGTAAVVQSSTAYGYDCSYLVEAVRKNPERIVGVGCVDITAEDALDTLDRWVTGEGLSGVRVFTTGTTMPGQADWLASDAVAPAWDWLAEHGVTVNVQLSASAYGDLRAVAQARPGLRIVLDHCGRPPVPGAEDDTEGVALCSLADVETIHLKLTSGNLHRSPPGRDAWLENALGAFGPGRIAWGSNFPASEGSYSDLVALARARFADRDDVTQREIFSGTARRLYPGLPARRANEMSPPATR